MMENAVNTDVQFKINKWVKNVLYSFVLCCIVIIIFYNLIVYLELSDKLIAPIFLICGAYYLYQISLIRNVKCPNCCKPLIYYFFGKNTLNMKVLKFQQCNNCGSIFKQQDKK